MAVLNGGTRVLTCPFGALGDVAAGTVPARRILDGSGVLCMCPQWEGRGCVEVTLF